MHTYYNTQQGSGMTPYAGIRFQKGHGFFGRLLKGSVLPLLKRVLPYLGKKALDTGVGILGDVYNRKPVRESIRNRAKQTASQIAEDALVRVRGMQGEGIKRRRARRRKTKGIVPPLPKRKRRRRTKRTSTKISRKKGRKVKRVKTGRRKRRNTKKAIEILYQ